MASKVVSFILDIAEHDLDPYLAAFLNEVNKVDGIVVREIRVLSDSGEEKIPANTVAGVTPPASEPTPDVPPVTPAPTVPPVVPPVEPTTEAPLDEPVDPTVQVVDTPDPTDSSETPSDTPA